MATSGTDDDADTADYIAVRRVQRAYADIVTRRAWPELHRIMAPGCVVTVDLVDHAVEFHGPQAIGDFIGGQLEQFDFFELVILNTVMEIDAARGRAAARMYIQEARQSVDTGARSDTFGVYHDRFDRDGAGRWRFSRRHYRSYARTTPPGEHPAMSVFPLAELSLRELLDD